MVASTSGRRTRPPRIRWRRSRRACARSRSSGSSRSPNSWPTDSFVHGTTIATNALIQRNGGPVGTYLHGGFRDVLYFRDGFKPERCNIHLRASATFVDRYLRSASRADRLRTASCASRSSRRRRRRRRRMRERGRRGRSRSRSCGRSPTPSTSSRVAELLAEQLPTCRVCGPATCSPRRASGSAPPPPSSARTSPAHRRLPATVRVDARRERSPAPGDLHADQRRQRVGQRDHAPPGHAHPLRSRRRTGRGEPCRGDRARRGASRRRTA